MLKDSITSITFDKRDEGSEVGDMEKYDYHQDTAHEKKGWQTSESIDSEKYTSNLTKGKNTISTDAGTVLERLEEVRRKYNDYYRLWAMEFDKLFVSELNYQSSKTLSEEY